MTESVSKVLESAESNLKLLREQIEDGESCNKPADNVTLQEFHSKLGDAVREIFKTTTRIAMLYTKSPYPNMRDTEDLMNSLEASAHNIVSVFSVLPKEQGQYFRNDVQKLVRKILDALPDFIGSLGCKGSKNNRDLFKSAGIVFAACDEVEKIPKNNLDSILDVLRDEQLMLDDALQELDEEVKNDFSAQNSGEEIDNTEVWNNQDRELLPPCVGLVKTAKSCLRKIIASIRSNGNSSTLENIQELDNVTTLSVKLSPAVDNFIAAIYPPMNQKSVKKFARNVVNVVQNLLNEIPNSHFMKEEDQKWHSFLLKAVDHNNNKLQPLLSTDNADESDDDGSDEDL